MKKFCAVLLLGTTLTLGLSAADNYAKPGDLTASAGLGLNFYGWGMGFSLLPGVEYGLAESQFAPQFVVDFGFAGRGYYSSYSYNYSATYTYGYTYLGLGA